MIRNLILTVIGLLGSYLNTAAQARLVLNGAKVNITNGAVLVIANGAANAITRHDGHLISEGENNKVDWHIGNTEGTYTVPLGYGASTYLPLSFTKTAGTGSGHISIATYRTGWNNSAQKPQGVGNLVSGSSDYSAQAIDRFWYFGARNYTVNPDISNLTFTYSSEEHFAPNQISETGLKAQRWNNTAQTWNEWRTESTADASINTVNVSAVAAGSISGWWTLASTMSALPVNFLSFDVIARGADVMLNWSTAMEQHNDYFVIERSAEGLSFGAIAIVNGGGNSSATLRYSYLDKNVGAGKWYYRLKQVDTNGEFKYSVIKPVRIEGNTAFTIFPNPVMSKTFFVLLQATLSKPAMLHITDVKGNTMQQQAVPAFTQKIQVQLGQQLPAGIYLVRLQSGNVVLQDKLIAH